MDKPIKLVSTGNGYALPIMIDNSNTGELEIALLVKSYTTFVAILTRSRVIRLWGGWSSTTARHIRKASWYIDCPDVPCKTKWLKLAVEDWRLVDTLTDGTYVLGRYDK